MPRLRKRRRKRRSEAAAVPCVPDTMCAYCISRHLESSLSNADLLVSALPQACAMASSHSAELHAQKAAWKVESDVSARGNVAAEADGGRPATFRCCARVKDGICTPCQQSSVRRWANCSSSLAGAAPPLYIAARWMDQLGDDHAGRTGSLDPCIEVSVIGVFIG